MPDLVINPYPDEIHRDRLAYAYREATKSPDPSTQTGALVFAAHYLHSQACNNFPPGVLAHSERLERPEKYAYIEHSERRAIYGLIGKTYDPPLTMYATWAACADCARAIVCAGIQTLYRHVPPDDDPAAQRWDESVGIGDRIMLEGGVTIVDITGPIPGAPAIRRDGVLWEPSMTLP